MTIVTRTTAKSYFETGDKPTQSQFGDLIDSSLFYEDTSDFGRSLISASAAVSARTILGAGAVGGNLFVAVTTASGQNQLGGGTVGKAVFESITTASAQNNIGGGTVGKQIFEATTTASAQNNIVLSLFNLSSRSSNGYIKLPINISGSFVEIIIQWGSSSITTTGAASVAGTAVSFPLAFPNAVYAINATSNNENTLGLIDNIITVKSLTTSGFNVNVFNPDTGISSTVYWFAIGY